MKQTETYIKATIVLAAMQWLSGCGVRVADSFVVGTTGYLAEVNRGKDSPSHSRLETHAQKDKQELNDLLRRY